MPVLGQGENHPADLSLEVEGISQVLDNAMPSKHNVTFGILLFYVAVPYWECSLCFLTHFSNI